jgi:hypothetical protein
MKTHNYFALAFTALTGLTAACGAAPSDQTATTDAEEGISSRTAAYVTLTRDTRRCVSPMCGGYFTTDVNTTRATQYVSAFDFSRSNLDEATLLLIQETPIEDLMIYGILGERETRFNTRPLVVLEAYRALPGIARRAGDGYHSVRVNNPPIQCITAPCNNTSAQLLNRTTAAASVTTLDVSAALAQLVDPAWATARIARDGALVAGRIVNGASLPGGRERILRASQVFIRLPFENERCPLARPARCPEGQVNIWQRNDDRCVSPAGCATPGACTLAVPSCAEGYTLSSWTGGMFGCQQFACDPTFTLAVQPEEPPFNRCHAVRCSAGFHCVPEGDDVCVPNVTCAQVRCGFGTVCVEGGQGAECVAPPWTEEVIDVRSASPYRNNERRAWAIISEVPNTTQIRLNFSAFDLEQGYDFVVVSDTNGNELARYTGKLGAFVSNPFPVSEVRVLFTTDSSITGAGFVIDRLDASTN